MRRMHGFRPKSRWRDARDERYHWGFSVVANWMRLRLGEHVKCNRSSWVQLMQTETDIIGHTLSDREVLDLVTPACHILPRQTEPLRMVRYVQSAQLAVAG